MFRPRKEAYRESAEGGHAHQEVLVQGLPFQQVLPRLLEDVASGHEVWHEIDEQQLPGLHRAEFLDDDGCGEQHGGDYDPQQFHSVFLFHKTVSVCVVCQRQKYIFDQAAAIIICWDLWRLFAGNCYLSIRVWT